MNDRIAQALTKLFERHRIVFWYDDKDELFSDYDSLSLTWIEKVELENNEFGLKHRMLRRQPKQKFLIYRKGPQPSDLDNWLLDIQLAQGRFSSDQIALWLSELELGIEFADVVKKHTQFYQAAKRKDALKRLLNPDDTPGMVRIKMLAICTAADPRMDSVLENLLAELAECRDEKFKLICRCNLDQYLWEQLKRVYGYESPEPGIKDIVIQLFKDCYYSGLDSDYRGITSSDALVFLNRWKDSRRFETAFRMLSDECARVLGIEKDLTKRDFRDLIELDYFRLIDQKIVSDLVRNVSERTVSSGDVALWVRQRRQDHWYLEFQHLYQAVDYASQFVHAIDDATLTMDSLDDGVQRYVQLWYRLDQLYRKFNYHVRCSGHASLMASLVDPIEKLYSNNYLLKINDFWQTFVDNTPKWSATSLLSQRNFFRHWISPFLQKDNKVYVIISDALRYEIGDEFVSRIRQEDRYDAELEPVLSMLPSYTQLGKAALLPNREIALADNDPRSVSVDTQSSQGIVNRSKILASGLGKKQGRAINAEEFLAMPRDGDNGYRALFRDNDVVYIYHNRIDSIGDKRDTEDRVFEAVEETLDELVTIVRKLSTANVTNMIVTSDHGFIYQNRPIEESDYSGDDAEGDPILFRDRRFVMGKNLKEKSGLRKFTSAELGLTGEMEVQIPKSINRLRLKGSGSRYVHGGASLQEVIIPVVTINKKRKSDISMVEIDILRGSSSLITSGQLAVALYQAQPVSDKVQPRTLRAAIYTEAEDLISDSHELTFDLTSADPRERELQVRFVLTRMADDANGQDVILRLDEKFAGTTHFEEYKSLSYTMRRSFTSDFDF